VTVALAFLAWGSLPAEEVGWPREIKTKDAVIVIYQPQPESLEGNVLKARTAVSVARGGATPVFGAVWGTASLDIDRDARTVTAIKMTIDRVRFPDVDDSQQAELRSLLEKEFATLDMTMSLDRLMTSLESSEREQHGEELKSDPPNILYSDEPALLISIEGDPELRPIGETKLMRVVNTPFPIVFDPARKTYYLFGSSVWFATDDLEYGTWKAIDAPPDKVAALFRGDERAEGAPTQPPAGEGVPPEKLRHARIVVATVPSELIVSDGDPRWSPVVGGDLLAMSNTDSRVFMEVDTQNCYVLLSGRWYKSKGLEGPWTHVPPPDLPAVFAKIPSSSKYADVRPHIPGTGEAEDAVADAIIPQTSAVSRTEAKAQVAYDGKPKFEKIPGTHILLATNTASQVLKVNGRFWLCEQGVWYVSDTPEGPWEVADERPEGVDDIPASSAAYNVKYVYIYDSTPDYVYVGYLPGYLGCYPYYGTVVYGTGWYYPAYVSPYYYYPHAWTWGFNVSYSPWYGWGYGMSWGAGWASFSWGWGYGWGGWYHGYYPAYAPYYRYSYPYGYPAGWNAGYWAGVHAGGYFGPGGYSPTTWTGRHPRPPVGSPGAVAAGGPAARVPRSAAYNLYARSENPNAQALRPASRSPHEPPAGMANGYGTRGGRAGSVDPRTGRAAMPPTAKRPEPSSVRPEPVASTRPSNASPGRVTPQPSRTRNNVYVDPNGDVYRFDNQKWERRQQGRWQAVDVDPTAPGRGNGNATGRPTSSVNPGSPGRPSGTPTTTRAPGRPTPSPMPNNGSAGRPTPPSAQPPPSASPSNGNGYGNRAVPRGGPSLDSARSSRERGSARVQQYGGGGSSGGTSRGSSGGASHPSGGGGGGGRPSGGARPGGGGGRPHH
jgi:hypothetical protein